MRSGGWSSKRKRPDIAKELLERRKRHWQSTCASLSSKRYTTLRPKGYASLIEIQNIPGTKDIGSLILRTNIHIHQHDIGADVDVWA